jgi:RimJ/RimL family protein N-acetyltransferase
MSWVKPVTLKGTLIYLEPLSLAHHDDLITAVEDGELWKLWYTTIPSPADMKKEITRRLDLQSKGAMLPFAVIDSKSTKAIGMTTYLNIDADNRRLEIGSTWYRQAVQRSGVNTECKTLLLEHAFENLNCIAVEFRTHCFNKASRAAIERLGAKLDGILRHHSICSNGTLRDTCVYSITADEWPGVKAHLTALAKKSRNL